MIEVVCSCGKQLRIPDKYAGKKGKCKGCGKYIHVSERSSGIGQVSRETLPPLKSATKRKTTVYFDSTITRKTPVAVQPEKKNPERPYRNRVLAATIVFILVLATVLAALYTKQTLIGEDIADSPDVPVRTVETDKPVEAAPLKPSTEKKAVLPVPPSVPVKQEATREVQQVVLDVKELLDYPDLETGTLYQVSDVVPMNKSSKGGTEEILPKHGCFRVINVTAEGRKTLWYEVFIPKYNLDCSWWINAKDLNGIRVVSLLDYPDLKKGTLYQVSDGVSLRKSFKGESGIGSRYEYIPKHGYFRVANVTTESKERVWYEVLVRIDNLDCTRWIDAKDMNGIRVLSMKAEEEKYLEQVRQAQIQWQQEQNRLAEQQKAAIRENERQKELKAQEDMLKRQLQMEYEYEMQKEFEKQMMQQQREMELQNRQAFIQEQLNMQMMNEMRYQEEQNRRHNERQVDRLLKDR